jgi:hypothetical protein
MCELTVCTAGSGNKRKTHHDLSTLLCLPVSPVALRRLTKVEKKHKQDHIRSKKEAAKTARTRRSVRDACALYKEQSKSTRHKNSKVPTKESAKAVVPKQKRHPCSRCGQIGHTQSICPMPKVNKSKVKLADWYIDEDDILSRIAKRPRKTKPKIELIDW